jgi:hypothetical protein
VNHRQIIDSHLYEPHHYSLPRIGVKVVGVYVRLMVKVVGAICQYDFVIMDPMGLRCQDRWIDKVFWFPSIFQIHASSIKNLLIIEAPQVMSRSILNGILVVMVRVYIIAFSFDLIYKHTKHWCKSSRTDDVAHIYLP